MVIPKPFGLSLSKPLPSREGRGSNGPFDAACVVAQDRPRQAQPERNFVTGSPLSDRLTRLIATGGRISVAQYMAQANAHYYATRDPLGAAGDFVTAPEISQMFGELVGACLADLWDRAGRPDGARYVELGPGRGTLAADALRAMRSAGLEPAVELVETSPVLRGAQAARLSTARWHDDLASLPETGPLLAVANEFFDALPIRQLVATEQGWSELMVVVEDGRFQRVPGPPRPGPAGAAPGIVIETSPASVAVASELARRLRDRGGALLIADYGHDGGAVGDTLQAVAGHAHSDPWQEPGERDLTAHVDFGAIREAAEREGVRVLGPLPQGRWLTAMGIDLRAAALARAAPERTEEIEAARERLVAPAEMGTLFKMVALVAPDWPDPAGFE
jgi:NADH dehydrogenase [ubiquinone] 1 alpha subcomplex assembly factor 7